MVGGIHVTGSDTISVWWVAYVLLLIKYNHTWVEVQLIGELKHCHIFKHFDQSSSFLHGLRSQSIS